MSIQIKKQLEKLLLGVVTAGLLFFAGSGHAVEQITYYHNDALGSPVAATDNTGTLLWREAYEPYGERLDKEAPGTDTVWYTGKQEESLFGLSYFGARWYDPEIGRFMATDPAGFNEDNIHSFNKYAYANNNPYKYLDPDGNSPLDIGFFIADSIKLAVAIYSGNAASIQTAAADLAASAVGLASPVPFTGQAIKAAKAGRQAAKIIGGAKGGVTKSGGQTFERVVSSAELKATQQTGLLRGGRQGENFFTNSASLDAKRAQQRLGLVGPLRDARIRFKITNDVGVTGPRSAAAGRAGTAGGGREFSTTGRTEIDILRIDPLRK